MNSKVDPPSEKTLADATDILHVAVSDSDGDDEIRRTFRHLHATGGTSYLRRSAAALESVASQASDDVVLRLLVSDGNYLVDDAAAARLQLRRWAAWIRLEIGAPDPPP